MGRLALGDTATEIILKLSDGNPGALTVIREMLSRQFHNVHGAMLILWLDEWEIYGSMIWVLFKDGCHEDFGLLERAIRSVQMGYLTKGDILDSRFDASTATLTVEEMFKGLKQHKPRVSDHEYFSKN